MGYDYWMCLGMEAFNVLCYWLPASPVMLSGGLTAGQHIDLQWSPPFTRNAIFCEFPVSYTITININLAIMAPVIFLSLILLRGKPSIYGPAGFLGHGGHGGQARTNFGTKNSIHLSSFSNLFREQLAFTLPQAPP